MINSTFSVYSNNAFVHFFILTWSVFKTRINKLTKARSDSECTQTHIPSIIRKMISEL